MLAAVLAVAISACDDSAVVMGPGGGTNAPPVIQSLVVGAPEVEVTGDQTVRLTATVTNVETAPTQLTYVWSASPANGTFIGTGAQVRWKAPATTPDTFTISLTVIESYVVGSTTKENRADSTVPARFNDLIIGGLVTQFLTDFGTFSVPPLQCVRNFSSTLCSKGRSDELGDVTGQRNRTGVQVESATIATPSVTVNAAGTSANVSTHCSFRDRYSSGMRQTIGGMCNLTAVYDNSHWYLCTSTFDPPYDPVVIDRLGKRSYTPVTDRSQLPPFSHP